jgi:putative addiction module killer protein
MTLAVREYLAADGANPFRVWLASLDISARARVEARVYRFEAGNLGDHKSVGGGVWEARCQFGPGYRIYFGKHRSTTILLLCGGDKASQARDIAKARQYWAAYLEAVRHGET